MRKFRRKQHLIHRERSPFSSRGRLAAGRSGIDKVLCKLKEYEHTELSPDEVHTMSERLTEFEKAGVEPQEACKLAKRDRAVPVKADDYGMMWCPECEGLIGVDIGKTEERFCKKCGQRVLLN